MFTRSSSGRKVGPLDAHEQNEYWKHEEHPRFKVPSGALCKPATNAEPTPEGEMPGIGLVGYYEGATEVSLTANAVAILTTTTIGSCLAIALRVYAQDGCLCWLFAPSDPETLQAVESWQRTGRVNLTADFGSFRRSAEVDIIVPGAVIEVCRTSQQRDDAHELQRWCDKVAQAECDGLLNAFAFAPMTHEAEKRTRLTCLVATTQVWLMFQRRT